MRDVRQAMRLAAFSAREATAFFATLAPDFADARAADLRFAATRERFELFLPHWNERPHAPEPLVRGLRARLAQAWEAATGEARSFEAAQVQSVDLTAALDVDAAALVAIRLAAIKGPQRLGLAEGAPGDAMLAVVQAAETAPEDLAAVIRQGRRVSLAAAFGAPGDVPWSAAVARLSGDADEGATMEGLQARLPRGRVALLTPQETPGGVLWLPWGLRLDPAARRMAGLVLVAMRSGGTLAADAELLLHDDAGSGSDDAVVALHLPLETPFAPAAEQPGETLPVQSITLRRVELAASGTELKALQAAITDRRFATGYRVSLRALPDRLRADGDVERLREEIEEREAEIALIEALGAPQLRLLRFSQAQLPALVDGLRRLPPTVQLSDHLLFASAWSAGRTASHYILYDPRRIAVDGRLPEQVWRRRTEDRPIGYWLDPYAARGMRGDGSEPLVFTPVRSAISPPLDSFGGRVDENLRRVLGALFADLGPALSEPAAKPLFLFSPSKEPGFEMEVEAMDARAFAPLHLQIPWLNDNLMVRAPRDVDRAALERLADDLYEGEVAHDLRQRLDADVAAVSEGWAEAADEISGKIAGLAARIGDEVAAVTERIALSLDYLQAAGRRIESIDASIDAVRGALSGAENELEGMASVAAGHDPRRLRFVRDLVSEIQRGQQTLADAEAAIQAREQELDDLLRRIDSA